MKKILHSSTLLLFLCCLLMGGLQEARASHLLGGDMTYVSLGNNQYRVKFRLYRDCTGITPSAFTLECRNGGCNATATVTAPFVQQGAVEAGNPFCSAVSSGPCQGPTGLPNYDVYNFLATVTLPPGNWTLSTDQNARPTLANIVGGDLYVEATLNNTNQGTTAVANNSPQFDVQDIPIQYVCWKQPTTITYSATEADGDSLVYALAAPLQACGTSATYNTIPGSTVTTVLTPNAQCPTCPLCVFQYNAASTSYSPTYPINLGVDTVGACPLKTGMRRPFVFNQQARTITFTPGVYNAAATPISGLNKYQIAVLITEYRRINGVRRVIGTVRREANLIVTDCGNNSTPNPVAANPVTVGSGTIAVNTTDTTRLDVFSCSYSRVQLNFTDPDNLRIPSANQLLTVTLPTNINTDPNLLDSGDVGTFTLSGNGTVNPKGTFFFQPSPSTVGRIIRLNIRIEDNACPIKGVQNRVVVIRVLKGNFATALATVGTSGIPNVTPVTLCSGSLALRGSVVRPDSVRRLATNTSVLQTYGYQWTLVSGDGFNTATATSQNINVNPSRTSRYRLSITPNSGFGPGCGDTTSILVRVAPPVVSRFTITDSISSRAVANPALAAGKLIPPIVYTFNNTSTINGLVPQINGQPANGYTSTVFKMDSIRWTYQRIRDAAGQPVTSAPVVFSRAYAPANRYNPGSLQLSIPGTYIIALSSSSTLITPTNSVVNRGQCAASVAQRIVIVPDLNVPNIITPNNDNLNDVFILPVSQRGGKLEIYNRWGRKVQEFANYQNTWGADQPDGVYYYYVTDATGNKTKGWVEVRRGQ